MNKQTLILLLTAFCFTTPSGAEDDSRSFEPRWWKGNMHTHSFWSDGNDFPEMIAAWYRDRGYHFLTLSDHNVLSEGMKWLPYATIEKRGGADVLQKYQRRFGSEWVETRGEPGTAEHAVRLKPLNEFRALVESRGEFIMIQSEEISDQAEGVPVHLNAANLKEVIPPVGGETVREAIENNFRALEEQSVRTGRETLLHLNHPNFHFAITAEDLAAVVAERFFEVYNGHPSVRHLGDDHHPSVERMWDIANTIRVDQLQAALLYGVATDDTHHYHGRGSSRAGRGWVHVRSRYLTPEHLLRAMKRGDFYASSGVELDEVTFAADSRTLKVHIHAEEGVTYRTEFIGTPVGYNRETESRVDENGKPIRTTRIYTKEIGTVFAVENGLHPSYQLTGKELFVRARITSSRPHPDGSFEGQFEQAWTQPVTSSVEAAD